MFDQSGHVGSDKPLKTKSQPLQNKVINAHFLPSIINCNPQSVYNKVQEFKTFLKMKSVDVAFLSESLERNSETLNSVFSDLKSYEIISNVYQRDSRGGRPALFVNSEKFVIQNLTQRVVIIPWGCEIVWAMLIPKGVKPKSPVQRIICAAVYSKPNSRKKTLLLDHICDTYNLLSSQYSEGTHWIIAGDVNELKIDSILSLHHKMSQVVDFKTRPKSNSDKIHDPVITTLSSMYQKPIPLPPLKSDNGNSESDHLIVHMEPILSAKNMSARKCRYVKIRRCPGYAVIKIKECFKNESWSFIFEEKSGHKKS